MAGINFVRRWVMSQMTKKADDGIMITLPDSSKVDLNVNITMDRLLRNGIDPDAFTNPQQVDNAINMINSRMVERAIPANSAEGREITEKLFGKQKAPVFDLEGNRIPEGSGIMGGKSIKSLMESGQVSKGARGMKKSKKVEDREMFQAANKRLTSDVDSIINNIKSMEPITAMKEANSVIARKGKYKNLTQEQSKKILQDTEDHIFERDIPEEDFATGGRAGYKSGNSVLDQALAVASVPYNFAKGMVGNVSNPGAVTDVSLTGAQTDFLDSIAKSKGPSGTIDYSDYGGPTKTFSGISGMNPMQASLATTMGGTGYNTNTDGSINYTGGAYDFNKGNVVTDFIDKGGILGAVDRFGDGAIGKVGASIYDAVNPEEDYDFSGIEGQTAGLGVISGVTGVLSKIFGPKAAAVIVKKGKDKIKSNIGKKILKPQIDKAINKIKTKTKKTTTNNSGGGGGSSQANVGGGNTAKNSLGQTAAQATKAGTGTSQGYSQHYADGGRIGFDDGDRVGQQKRSYRPEDFNEKLGIFSDGTKISNEPMLKTPTRNPEGITSTIPIEKSSSPIENSFAAPRFMGSIFDFTNINDKEETESKATGGRAGFMAGGMGRRAFLKLMGGTGATIGAAKSGIFSGFGKGAGKQVAKEVVQKSTTTPPPYFFKLAEKIKMLGDDATATTDRTIAKTLKSKDGKSTYVLEEDVTSGDTIIKKINKEGDEMITDVEIMELKKGEVVKGKDGRPVRTPDEYEEVTEANARIEGDTFNDPYYSDGIEIDDILREVDDIPVPKASGGIARMLGE
jgi:hypothetical protein